MVLKWLFSYAALTFQLHTGFYEQMGYVVVQVILNNSIYVYKHYCVLRFEIENDLCVCRKQKVVGSSKDKGKELKTKLSPLKTIENKKKVSPLETLQKKKVEKSKEKKGKKTKTPTIVEKKKVEKTKEKKGKKDDRPKLQCDRVYFLY